MVRIMIAEDSDSTRMFLRDVLETANYEVVEEAIDGNDAIKKFKLSKPDILLLDNHMPKKDGLTTLMEIKTIDPHAKVIMITISDEQKLIEDCINAGALAYISKPFEMDTVLKAISYVLED